MSIPVDLDALRDEVARHERPAYVITAGDAGSPHLVAQFLAWADGAFETECGGTTARNLAQRDAGGCPVDRGTWVGLQGDHTGGL